MTSSWAEAAEAAPVLERTDEAASWSVLLIGALGPGPGLPAGAAAATPAPGEDPFAPLDDLLHSSDVVVAHLATPLAAPSDHPPAGAGPRQLLGRDIAAITLAGHPVTAGEEGLRDTLAALSAHGVLAAGAGLSPARAGEPLRLRLRLPGGVERGISLLAGVPADVDDPGEGVAASQRPGVHPLSVPALHEQIRALRAEHPQELIIVAPHWRGAGRGADPAQLSFAREVTRAGADLVIGHGSPAAQEIGIANSRLVLHGIGPLLPETSELGRDREPGGEPAEGGTRCSVVVRLHLTAEDTQLRVYPLAADGHGPSARNRPVTAEQFEQFYLSSLARSRSSAAFLRAIGAGQDAQGRYLEVPLTRRHRVRINRHRRGIGTTMTYWEPEPVEIEFDRRRSNNHYVLERELHRQGATFDRIAPGTLTGRSSGGEPFLMQNSVTHHTGVPATRGVKRKDLARRILQAAGAGVPPGAHFDSAEDLDRAAALMDEIGPVVVKPVDGNIGRGVTVGVATLEQLRAAWAHAFSQTRSGVLVEQQFEGEEFRISVVDGVACAATRRVPPQITGDGVRTVRELINDRNDERHRHLVLHSKPLDLAGSRLNRLLEAGLTPLSVLPAGQTYVIDRMGSVGSGAHPEHCLEDIDPSYLRSAERAARAFPDLDMAGIDMLCSDTSEPASAENHIIIEVNSKPEVATHAAAPSPRAPRGFPALLVASALRPRTPGPVRPRARRPRAPEAPSSARLLAAELAARGLDITWWTEEHFHARAQDATVSVWGSATDRTGSSAQVATRNEELARALLRRAHLPVPTEGADDRTASWPRLHLLVAHGRVLAALDPADPSRRGVLRGVHTSHRAVAAAAARAVPGLDLAEVTIAAQDPRGPAVRRQTVVERVRAEPDLVAFAAAAGRRQDVVRTVVDLHLGGDRPAPEGEVSWASPTAPPPRPRPRPLGAGLRRRARHRAGPARGGD